MMSEDEHSPFDLLIKPAASSALGHLGPALRTSWAIAGSPTLDIPFLVLLFSMYTLKYSLLPTVFSQSLYDRR